MSSVRNWAVGSAVAALILASPAVALLAVIVAEMPIDLLIEAGALALLGLTTITALGWVVLQRQAASPMETHIPKNQERSGPANLTRQVGSD